MKSFPTVKVFLAGRKNREPIDYDGAHTTEGIVEWAFETMAANIPVSDVLEVSSVSVSRWHCNTWKDPYMLCPVSEQSPQGRPFFYFQFLLKMAL